MLDAFRLGTIYHSVYGHVRNRIERLGISEDPDDLVVDPLEAAGSVAAHDGEDGRAGTPRRGGHDIVSIASGPVMVYDLIALDDI